MFLLNVNTCCLLIWSSWTHCIRYIRNRVSNNKQYYYDDIMDRLCGLVVRVPGYTSRGPGSIRGATRFSEK
jgi:hypothetical protein